MAVEVGPDAVPSYSGADPQPGTGSTHDEIASSIEAAARPSAEYFLLLTLSTVIATFGLIANSVAVIIGGMLVAPLMNPIMGFALTSIRSPRSSSFVPLATLVSGIVLVVSLSATLAWAAAELPFDALAEIPLEVANRSHPSFFDLAVALAGGAAGAYATVRIGGAAALIGVAIATALVPPLCATGIAVAVGDAAIARGALLLFLTNFVAIAFAALAVFMALGFRSRGLAWGLAQGAMTGIGVVVLGALLAGLTVRTFQDAREEARTRDAVVSGLAQVLPGSELLSLDRSSSGNDLTLRIRVQVPDTASVSDVQALQESVADRLNHSVKLVFVGVPTLVLESVAPASARTPAPETQTPTPTRTPTLTPTPTASAAASTPQPPQSGNAGLVTPSSP